MGTEDMRKTAVGFWDSYGKWQMAWPERGDGSPCSDFGTWVWRVVWVVSRGVERVRLFPVHVLCAQMGTLSRTFSIN